MYYIFAFKSRTSAMSLYEILKRNGIHAIIINTPPAAQLGCGLSVKVSQDVVSRATSIFRLYQYSSFLGLFRISYYGGRYEVERV